MLHLIAVCTRFIIMRPLRYAGMSKTGGLRGLGMELYQVKYFLALCETLNFTRAASNCNVSQPSLTRAIQNLEGEFGGPLFHRERQRTI